MPKTEEQNKKIREQKKELIKKTALHLFADNGFHNTSVEKIAKKANISKGLIYNYFKSKEDILKKIVKGFINEMYEYFDPNHDDYLTEKEFFYFIDKAFLIISEKPIEWKIYTRMSLQKKVLHIIESDNHDFTEKISKILYNFFKEKTNNDVEAEILFFASLMKGAILQFIGAPDSFPLEKTKNKIIDFYKQKFKEK